jgi:uncharacterized membrane protein YcaP (DUF421 family)
MDKQIALASAFGTICALALGTIIANFKIALLATLITLSVFGLACSLVFIIMRLLGGKVITTRKDL